MLSRPSAPDASTARLVARGLHTFRPIVLILALAGLLAFGPAAAREDLLLVAAAYGALGIALRALEACLQAALARYLQIALDLLATTLLVHFTLPLGPVAAALCLIPLLDAAQADGPYAGAAVASAALVLLWLAGLRTDMLAGEAATLYVAGIGIGMMRAPRGQEPAVAALQERPLRDAARELSAIQHLSDAIAFAGERLHALSGAAACVVRLGPHAADSIWCAGISAQEAESDRADLAARMQSAQGEAVLLRAQDLPEERARAWAARGLISALLLPLPVADDPRACGFVELRFTGSVDLAARRELLMPLAHHAALALGRQQQREEAESVRRAVAALHAGAASLSQGSDRAAMLSAGVALARRLGGARHAALALWDEQGGLRDFCAAGPLGEEREIGRGPIAESILQYARSAREPVRGLSSEAPYLGIPLRLGAWTGCLCLLHKEGMREFSETDAQICDLLAGHLATALGALERAGAERERYGALLELLGAVTDAREREVAGHSQRVAAYARAIAEALSLPPDEVERIGFGALLHDIGKIAVPDAILRKPGRLSDEERSVMISHAAIGGQIVAGATALAPLAPLVRHHHEWFNGRGYPDALAGEAIPLGARVLAVADALDSLTTDRPYRKAQTFPEAFAELRRGAAGQFDPQVVAAAAAALERGAQPPPPALLDLHSLAQQEWDLRAAAWRVLRHLGERLRSVMDIEALGADILDLLSQELGYVRGSLSVLEPSGEELRIVASQGLQEAIWPGMIIARGRGVSWEAVDAGRTASTDDLEADLRHVGRAHATHHSAVFIPLIAAGGAVQGVLAVHRPLPATFSPTDIEQLEALAVPIAEAVSAARLHDELRQMMSRDPLTGALDRQTGLRELEAALAARAPLAILLFDFDDLAGYNDAHGTAAGDLALQRMADGLRGILEPGERLSRYGGDSFLALLPLRDARAAMAAASSLAGNGALRWSWGAAQAPRDGETATALIAAAHAAIAQARKTASRRPTSDTGGLPWD